MVRLELKASEFILIFESIEYYYNKKMVGSYGSEDMIQVCEKILKYGDSLSDNWKKWIKEFIMKVKKELGIK